MEVTIKDYVENPDKEALLNVGSDMRKINYSFYILKVLIKLVFKFIEWSWKILEELQSFFSSMVKNRNDKFQRFGWILQSQF